MNNYILGFLLFFTVSSSAVLSDSPSKTRKAETEKIVFKSTDGGKSWQDISKGLPVNLEEDGRNSFFANDKGLFVKVGKGLYQNAPKAAAPFWTKTIVPNEDSSFSPGRSAISYWGVNVKKTNGSSIWSPLFDTSHLPRIRSVFETAAGAVFIGTDRGLFKTVNDGKTWKHVHTGNFAGHLAESVGVLLAASMKTIIRSTDNGENWAVVATGDNMAFDVKPIYGGFVAITAVSETSTRSLMTSHDDGKTWQSIEVDRQNKSLNDSIWRTWNNRPDLKRFATSITQVGENFLCTHAEGIFRSTDTGKTWTLLLPSVEDKSFNLFVSGNAIYAVLSKGGC